MAERTVQEINAAVREDARGFIAHAEREYYDQIGDLARQIAESHTRVILLAGPSSSGKTTTANMLADRLRENGHPSKVISLDDFYYSKDNPAYPRNAAGELDYESPYALQIDRIRDTIRHIIAGQEFTLPRFDFRVGMSFDDEVSVHIPENGCAIIEGLHALNPILIEGIEREKVVKVFVSVSTNIMYNGRRILTGRKIRFCRRLSRDFLYRASDAHRTISLWDGVRDGENTYLYPFKQEADFRFDTFHPYELGVLKPFAYNVLEKGGDVGPYAEVVRRALHLFDEIPLDMVPVTSMIREFLPGGIYEDLY